MIPEGRDAGSARLTVGVNVRGVVEVERWGWRCGWEAMAMAITLKMIMAMTLALAMAMASVIAMAIREWSNTLSRYASPWAGKTLQPTPSGRSAPPVCGDPLTARCSHSKYSIALCRMAAGVTMIARRRDTRSARATIGVDVRDVEWSMLQDGNGDRHSDNDANVDFELVGCGAVGGDGDGCVADRGDMSGEAC